MFEEEARYSALSVAAGVSSKVCGMTHGYYRYPARFGDAFVREAIANFSKPDDLVLDPFCGGGTTLVEALAAGRCAAGSDVSPLALFVTRAKTTPLSEAQLELVGSWVEQTTTSVRELLNPTSEADDHRLTGLPQPFRNLLGNLKDATLSLPKGATRNFARCLLLRVAQWAFDGKEKTPTPSQIVAQLAPSFAEMSRGMREFSRAAKRYGKSKKDLLGTTHLCQGPAKDLSLKGFGVKEKRVSLVVTSPPYLGVHVLYNKWQLEGRKELRSAFYLTDCEDIGGASSYTIIDRKARSHLPYYLAIQESFAAVAQTLNRAAYVIQLVSFNDAEAALPHYLSAMKRSGLELCETYMRSNDGLHWRAVPGRRWYARVGAIANSSANKEVLLVHRKGEVKR